MSLLNKSINIFCIIAKVGLNRHRYIDDIMNDKRFIRKNKLKRLIYTTTISQREEELMHGDKYNYITIKDFKAIDPSELIESRSYYTIDQGTVYYCTKVEDFNVNNNLICITSPYQFEYYKKYCDNENIKLGFEKYKLYAIIIDATLVSRLKSLATRFEKLYYENDSALEELALYDLCRRIISEKGEFDDVFKRHEELQHPMLNKNVCFIDGNIYNDIDYYDSNLNDIKMFIKNNCK